MQGRASPQAATKAPAVPAALYHIAKIIPLASDVHSPGPLAFDPSSRRLFVSAGKHLVVIDPDAGAIVGEVRGIGRTSLIRAPDSNVLAVDATASAIAIAPELNRGFAVDALSSRLMIFDTKTLALLEKVHTGEESSLVVYDPASKRVFTFSTYSKNCKVFDGASGKLIQVIKLQAFPRGGVTDSDGHIYFSVGKHSIRGPRPTTEIILGLGEPTIIGEEILYDDPGEIIEIDARTLKVTNHWKEPQCLRMNSIGIDVVNHRLIARCKDSVGFISTDSGQFVPAITFQGGHLINLWFGAGIGDVFVSATPGPQLLVLHNVSVNKLAVSGRISEQYSWQMAFDDAGRRFFTIQFDMKLLNSTYKIPVAAPGTFRVAIYAKN
ncbi:MAG: YncE family protein [Candidatus Acidiferrales bacterium]